MTWFNIYSEYADLINTVSELIQNVYKLSMVVNVFFVMDRWRPLCLNENLLK